MSATNAISAISVVGAIVAAGSDHRLAQILGFVAVTCATINVVGGFLITDRMLRMFQRGRKPAGAAAAADGAAAESGADRRDQA
jgi:NAD(P) transhydrogenase subunit alpha